LRGNPGNSANDFPIRQTSATWGKKGWHNAIDNIAITYVEFVWKPWESGNPGVGIVLGLAQFNWDLTLIKETKIREGHTIQFRTEFYNAFNHPQFANPNTGIRSGTLGQISGTSVNPRIIQFGLKYSF
jgi:hypothetical protein